MKFRDIFAMALLVVLAVAGKIYGTDPSSDAPSERRPDPGKFAPAARAEVTEPPRGSGRELPPESFNDPRLIVEVEDKTQSATGTAFSINRSGVWITARHVTDDCDVVALEARGGKLVRTRRIAAQDYADISVLWTGGGGPAIPVIDPTLRIGQDGYSFGYPKGSPGDVHARLIGRGKMLARGRYRSDEPVVAWTQIRRIPDRGADLSGISGGPWVNTNGEVIGVHVAGAPRRGRSYSTAPRTLLQAIRDTKVRPAASKGDLPPKSDLTPNRFARYGNDLRQRQTVAKVICLVGEKWRRMRRDLTS